MGSAGGERLFYCFCSHLRPRNKEAGGHFLQLQNFFLVEAKHTSNHSNGRGMPKSEIWIQEVPVSLQNVLEDGVGLEGVSAPPCSQHYLQSKGPRNTKLTTSLTFLHLLIYLLFICVCVCPSVTGRVSRTEDNLGCQSPPSTLFERGPLLVFLP